MTTTSTDIEFAGVRGRIVMRHWSPDAEPERIVLIVHGYGEHSGRYEHVARRLADDGAVVFADDHLGHGRSEGERASVEDFDDLVTDLESVHSLACGEHSELPVVMIGHSLGGIIATRFVQTRDARVDALVLSGPVIGGNPELLGLLELDPIPDIPIDPEVLSRDLSVGAAYASDDLVYHGPFRRETLTAIHVAVEAIAAGPGFGALPVLWIHGEEDELAPLEITRPVAEGLAGEDFTAVVYPGARHEIFNETNQDEVLDDVGAFIARVVSQGTRPSVEP